MDLISFNIDNIFTKSADYCKYVCTHRSTLTSSRLYTICKNVESFSKKKINKTKVVKEFKEYFEMLKKV